MTGSYTTSPEARKKRLVNGFERRKLSIDEYRKALVVLLIEEQKTATSLDAEYLLEVNTTHAQRLMRELALEGKIRPAHRPSQGTSRHTEWELGVDDAFL